MKVKREEIDRLMGSLRESGLMTMLDSRAVLFFPIESETKAEETESGVLLLETRKDGASSLVRPGVTVSKGDSKKEEVPSIGISYASVEYAAPFSVREYHDIAKDNGWLSDEDLEFLFGLDCLIIRKENVLLGFDPRAEIGLES
jgi:hypothetical protein